MWGSQVAHYYIPYPLYNSQWGRDFLYLFWPALGHTQPPVKLVPHLSWVYSGQGMTLMTHPHLAPRLKKEYSYSSTPPLGPLPLSIIQHYSKVKCAHIQKQGVNMRERWGKAKTENTCVQTKIGCGQIAAAYQNNTFYQNYKKFKVSNLWHTFNYSLPWNV